MHIIEKNDETKLFLFQFLFDFAVFLKISACMQNS